MNPQVKGFAPMPLAAIDAWLAGQRPRAREPDQARVIMADGKLVTAADLDLLLKQYQLSS
jgi:hypothetical protein